jgi:acetyl esterase/lipase
MTTSSSVRARITAVMFCVMLAQGCSAVGFYSAVAGRDTVSSAAVSDISYGGHPRQKLDVYEPAPGDRPSPVVVFFYGGSWNSGNRQDYAFVGSALASRGFLTVIADYRLVPEVRFPAFIEDSAGAVKWVQDNAKRFGGDPARIALAGHSAGAYNAVMLALDPAYLRSAGVDRARIKAVVGLSGPYDFYPFDVSATIEAFGQSPNSQRTQPVKIVNGRTPAMLLATGAQDTTVYPRNTYALAAKLRASGTASVVKTYPDLGHAGTLLALSKLRRDSAPVLEDMVQFLNRSMK